MRLLFWIALKLRLRQKFWGDWYIKWHRKQVDKYLGTLDLDTSDIKIIEVHLNPSN